MATKKQQDQELESFTIRVPSWLKSQLEKLKGSQAGVTTTSDAARYALERGMDLVNPENDAKELYGLQANEQLALRQIAAKGQKGELLFSRAELALVAQWASRAYALTRQSLVGHQPLRANLQAFAAFISLRDSIYGVSEVVEGRDRYYMGNLGGIQGETVLEKNNLAIATIGAYANAGLAQFASRNLDVALRDEPPIPLDLLNAALRPYIPALIKLALRGYLLSHDKPAVPANLEFNSHLQKIPSLVKKGDVTVSPTLVSDSITAAIILDRNDVIVSINSYLELIEFSTLVNALERGDQLSGSRFLLIAPNQFVSQYLLRVSGVQIAFKEDDFESMKAALKELIEQPVIRSECERLAWIFGEL